MSCVPRSPISTCLLVYRVPIRTSRASSSSPRMCCRPKRPTSACRSRPARARSGRRPETSARSRGDRARWLRPGSHAASLPFTGPSQQRRRTLRAMSSMEAGVVDLRGRVVLVPGGRRRIGAPSVRALPRAGPRVFFTYRERQAEAEALRGGLGENALAYRLDVADGEALPAAVDACIAHFGALDVLVNNAAIFAENPFDGDDYAAWRAGWRRTFEVNLFGAADLAWLAMRAMRARGEGAIVNVASRAAHRGELSFADYGASKAALVNLTKSIASSCPRRVIVGFAAAHGL